MLFGLMATHTTTVLPLEDLTFEEKARLLKQQVDVLDDSADVPWDDLITFSETGSPSQDYEWIDRWLRDGVTTDWLPVFVAGAHCVALNRRPTGPAHPVNLRPVA
jgi:hypothetical protein